MKTPPTPEERVWAVLAHLSALAFGMGLLLPVIGWSEQRGKSKYAAFQSLQALGYQSLGFTIWLLVLLLLWVVMALVLTIGLEIEGVLRLFRLVFWGIIALISIVIITYAVLPVIVGVQCALGRDANYPILGVRLRRYLVESENAQDVWFIEDREDRWVAAMSHLSVINLFWGMLAPATAWFMQGKRSSFLKFQSVQAVVFQATAFVLLLVAIFFVFGGTLLFATSMSVFIPGAESLIGLQLLVGGLIYIVSQFCSIMIFVLIPLLHITGQYAGYRVLKGDDYQYPIIGKIIKNRLDKRSQPTTTENSN